MFDANTLEISDFTIRVKNFPDSIVYQSEEMLEAVLTAHFSAIVKKQKEDEGVAKNYLESIGSMFKK